MTVSVRKELPHRPLPSLPLLQSWMVQKLLLVRCGGRIRAINDSGSRPSDKDSVVKGRLDAPLSGQLMEKGSDRVA